jgi:hypothetical protein
MEVGTWVNDREFNPEIGRSSGKVQMTDAELSAKCQKASEVSPLIGKDKVANVVQSISMDQRTRSQARCNCTSNQTQAERQPEQT